jgi:hypothetical protein
MLEDELDPPAATNPTRIKVRSIEKPSAEEPAIKRTASTEDSHAARAVKAEPRHHPLEDESPITVVESSKAPAKRPRRERAFEDTEPSKPAHRHPLDDDDDAPAKPAARKMIRAVEVAPQSDAEPTRSGNPFDPIETDQNETSSVDTPAVRVRLRAVN